jgi:hypothetical protein
MSSSHHPQTDGQTERLNATLEQLLRIYVTSAAPNWSDHLPDIQFVYNSSRQSATQASPFLVLYGFEPSTPSRLVAARTSTEDALAPAAGSLCDATAARHRLIADRLAEAQATMAFYADKSRRPVEFKVGDQVLLSTQHIRLDSDAERPCRKLRPVFCGPYAITERVGRAAYRLQLPASAKFHDVFHVSQLRLYSAPISPEIPLDSPSPLPPPHATLEVDHVIRRRTRAGKLEFLVQWKTNPYSERSWIPASTLPEHSSGGGNSVSE